MTSIEEFIPPHDDKTTHPLGHPIIVFQHFEIALEAFLNRYRSDLDFDMDSQAPILPLLANGNEETIEDTVKRVHLAIQVIKIALLLTILHPCSCTVACV